jgi:hypothetical protein
MLRPSCTLHTPFVGCARMPRVCSTAVPMLEYCLRVEGHRAEATVLCSTLRISQRNKLLQEHGEDDCTFQCDPETSLPVGEH